MRACIYGAGAMGTVLGAFISRAGKEIDLITRNRSHVEMLNASGARVSFAAGSGFTQKVTALTPDKMSGRYDIIFLMTKQRLNREVCTFLKDCLSDGGVVCTLQNGLPERSVAEVIGEDKTLGCAVSWGATFVEPGHVMLTSAPDAMTFSLGSPFFKNQKAELVKPYLECAGEVEEIENFVGARWSKLIVNAAFSSLSALTSLTFGQIAKGRKSRRLAQAILKEGIDCALANGITPAPIQGHDLVKWLNYNGRIKKALSYLIIPFAMKKHKNLVSGMYYDLISGKKCDMDLVAGVIKEYGEKAGIPTPVTNAALKLCSLVEEGKASVSPDNILRLTHILNAKRG